MEPLSLSGTLQTLSPPSDQTANHSHRIAFQKIHLKRYFTPSECIPKMREIGKLAPDDVYQHQNLVMLGKLQ